MGLLAPLFGPFTGLAARLLGWGLAALAVWGAVHVWQMRLRQEGYDRAAQAYAAEADAQASRNRARARAAEVRYIERERVRVEYFEQAKTEVHDATADLARCVLNDGAVRLLNDAAARAREDRPAARAAGEQVPDTP